MAEKTVTIKLGGDSSGLQSELLKAARATTDLGGTFERLARGQGVELSSSIQKNVDQLKILRDSLVKINAPASDVAAVTKKLAEEQSRLDAALKTSSASSNSFAGFMKQHGVAIGATLTAIGGAALAFGKASVGAFEESEIALAQLNNVITSTGGVAGVTAAEVLEMSAAIQKSTGISDEAVTTAQSMLLSFTKIGKDVFPDVTRAVTDMATFMNHGAVPSMEQLSQTAIQIGKAMQSPVEGVAALQRVGVRLSESQKELVKSLVETGRTADAQRVILKELQTEFGGAANAAGKTFRGQLSIARAEMNDFQEDVGGKIVPVLQGLMRDFPTASKGAILLGDSIGGLNIRAGDLLVALPLMKTAFGGLGLANIASGFSGISGAIGLLNPITLAAAAGLGAFLVAYAKIAEEKAVNAQLQESIDLMQKFADMGKAAGVSAGVSAEGLRALRAQAALLATNLKETRTEAEIFAELVKKATAEGIKPMTGEVGLWVKKQGDLKLALDYSRPSLAAQITALEKEIATMKKSGVEKELVFKAEDRLTEMKKKLTAQSKELVSALEKEQKAALGKIPALESEIKLSAKYIAGLEREIKLHPENTRLVVLLTAAKGKQRDNIKELNSLLDQEIVLTDRYGNVTKTTTGEVYRFIEATKDLDDVLKKNSFEIEAMNRALGLTGPLLQQLDQDALRPKSALVDLDSAFKTLGITSTKTLQTQVTETRAAYDSIIAKYGEASREGQIAWAAMSQAQIDATRHAGGEINNETQRAVDAIKSKYGDLKNDKNANLSSWRELASKQVSTLVSDVSKGFADILTSGGNFGSKIVAMFKQIGQGMLQGFFESGIGGLLSGKGLAGFGGFAGGLLDAIKGIGGGKGGGLTSLAGLGGIGSLFAGGGAAGLSAAGGLAFGSTALSAGVAGALPTTFVNTGIMAGGTAAGAGGGLAATLGALATNPITIAAAATIAGVLLTRRLTRRGREKEDATTQAEDMSGDVWQGIVPEVQAGRATIDEGIAAIQQRFADYEAWLRANLKDQTVITRSIESQRITVTESIAVLEQLRGKEAETSALRAGLEKAIEDFAKTGAISQEFSDLIVKLGGNLEEFKANIADTSQLEKLQAGFSGLRDELVAMIPPAEDMFAAFLRTGEVSEDLRKALDETGLSARAQTAALLKMAEFTKATDNLEDFTFGIGSLREELGRLAIPVRSAYESFVELNEITPELRDEINRFGLDIEAFESFSAIKSLRDDFLSLSQSILATGEGAAALKPIFESVGADTSILGAADQIKSLRAQQTELQAFMADLAKIAPPAAGEKSNLQRFIETGMILPDWALELQNKGVDTTKFGAFTEAKGQKETMDALVDEFAKTKVASQAMQDMAAKFNMVVAGSGEQMAAQMKTIQAATDAQYKAAAAALGIEIGKLAESVETEIGKLRTALETALTDVGTKLDKQFEDSRIALIGQLNTLETSLHDAVTVATNGLIGALGKIDTHLTNAVNGLKTDLNTAINNLTAAINGVNIPGGSTTSTPPESNYPTTPEPTTHTGDRSSRGGFDDYVSARLSSAVDEGAGSISALAPSLQLQQQYGKSPELQSISEMAIMPAVLERIQVSVARLESGRGGSYAPPPQSSTGAAAVAAQPIQLTQNNTYTLELEDAYRIREQQERSNQNFVDMLARGG